MNSIMHSLGSVHTFEYCNTFSPLNLPPSSGNQLCNCVCKEHNVFNFAISYTFLMLNIYMFCMIE